MNAVDISFIKQQERAASQRRFSALPSTEQLLTSGGDARIALNRSTGANKYGCRPIPNANISAFGSATATTISAPAFSAANHLRNRLERTVLHDCASEVYADEMNRIRQELNELCGLRNGAGADIIFAASGTDMHLIAAQLAAKDESMPMRMLMVDTAETGSGVTAALSGRHFGNRTALGETVTKGALIGQHDHGQVVSIPLRKQDGSPRHIASIDADFERQVAEAAAAGERILLIMVDVSKTGMLAPSVACTVDLHRRYAGKLEVLVDACQFRMSPATLQAYLAQGFMVGMTGSKFIGGPSFSGALLIPAILAKKMRTGVALDKLLSYSTRADWPAGWHAANRLDSVPNFGLLLRWESALRELREFRSLSNIVVIQFLQAFSAAITQRLSNDPMFEMLPVPELNRNPFDTYSGWDTIQTIFPFLLFKYSSAGSKKLLSSEKIFQVYRELQAGAHKDDQIQLAQPVDCGRRGGIALSALRICVSSRLVVAALHRNGNSQQLIIDQALGVLDKVAGIIDSEQVDAA
jgi:hypothetical protein